MYRGDTAAWDFTVTEPDGTAVDLTNADDIRFTVKARITDADGAAVAVRSLAGGVTILDAVGGIARVKMAVADTSSMTGLPLRFFWDLQLTDASANVYTVASGTLEVRQDVGQTA